MAKHCYDRHHPFEEVNATLFHYAEHGNRLNSLEEAYTIDAVQRNPEKQYLLNDLSVVFINPFLRNM